MILVLLDICLVYGQYQILIELEEAKLYSRYIVKPQVPMQAYHTCGHKRSYLCWVMGFYSYRQSKG